MGQLYAESFDKGENARIVSFVARDGSLELDEITINKTLPEGSFGSAWLKNEKSHMVVRAIRGAGRIAIRHSINGDTLMDVGELGDSEMAVEVPPNHYYAWQADYNEELVVSAAFAPAFDPQFYTEKTEVEIRAEELPFNEGDK